MTALSIGAGVAAAGSLYSLYKGIKDTSKASDIEKNLKRPAYQIPQEFVENRNIARQMATLGLPQAQYNNQLNQINANQAAALATASRSANPGGAVGNIVGQSNAGINALNAEDAQARLSNERYFLQQNAQLGGQKLAQQQANVFDPYTQKYNEMQAYRGAGQQNINTGIQDLSLLGGNLINYADNNRSSKNTSESVAAAGKYIGQGIGQGMQLPPWLQTTYGQQPQVPYGTNWQLR